MNISNFAKDAEISQQMLVTAAIENQQELGRIRRILHDLKNDAISAAEVDLTIDEVEERVQYLVRKLLQVNV